MGIVSSRFGLRIAAFATASALFASLLTSDPARADSKPTSAAPPAAAPDPEVAKSDDDSAWVTAKPAHFTQFEKPASERGINPCATPDPGWGIYAHWTREPTMGQMITPERGGISANGDFDLMIHFHGHESARKEWIQVMDGAVLVGIDLGIGSGPYEQAFQSPDTFRQLVDSVEKAVATKTHHAHAHARKVGLSAWSAGYGAVQTILSQSYGKARVDSVILLDGLHGGYAGKGLDERQLAPFIDFARAAATGEKFMFVSHSSIIPPGYASTTETAHLLIAKVGGKPARARARASDPMGLELIGRFDKKNFHVRGYSGNGKLDHCAQIGLYRDILRVHIKPRWHSPRGYAAATPGKTT